MSFRNIRTEVEVVVLCVADSDEEDNDVDDGYSSYMVSISSGYLEEKGSIRFAEGSLPKCLAWYLPRMPLALDSGAAPRGSFS